MTLAERSLRVALTGVVRDDDPTIIADMQQEIDRLNGIVDFVESWVTNPVGAYSLSALDGLFSMTRDKINAGKP